MSAIQTLDQQSLNSCLPQEGARDIREQCPLADEGSGRSRAIKPEVLEFEPLTMSIQQWRPLSRRISAPTYPASAATLNS
jgi:hypothetical protein